MFLRLLWGLVVGQLSFDGQDVEHLGIPTPQQYYDSYARHMRLDSTPEMNFYVTFILFRGAAIMQGVYKRFLIGELTGECFVDNRTGWCMQISVVYV